MNFCENIKLVFLRQKPDLMYTLTMNIYTVDSNPPKPIRR